mmetsp:Transcript_51139/g.91071  ORF Transcript_51139/g.91071 Transcript_51139/m.91071 type:complete len:352 (+) Transcript_51139:114-1169(+)
MQHLPGVPFVAPGDGKPQPSVWWPRTPHLVFTARHPEWSDKVVIYKDGWLERVEHYDRGWWELRGSTLVLNWEQWQPESLNSRDAGWSFFGAGGFTLRCKSAPSWWRNRFLRQAELGASRQIEPETPKKEDLELLREELPADDMKEEPVSLSKDGWERSSASCGRPSRDAHWPPAAVAEEPGQRRDQGEVTSGSTEGYATSQRSDAQAAESGESSKDFNSAFGQLIGKMEEAIHILAAVGVDQTLAEPSQEPVNAAPAAEASEDDEEDMPPLTIYTAGKEKETDGCPINLEGSTAQQLISPRAMHGSSDFVEKLEQRRSHIDAEAETFESEPASSQADAKNILGLEMTSLD